MSAIHFPEDNSQVEKLIDYTELHKSLLEIIKSEKNPFRFQRNLMQLPPRFELNVCDMNG